MIEFLPYGNVTVAASVLALALLVMIAALQLLMYIGRFALSLDSEGAPKLLTENWLAVMVEKYTPKRFSAWHKRDLQGRYYDSCFGIWQDSYWFSSPTSYDKANGCGAARLSLLGTLVVMQLPLLLTDLVILWLQTHFMSAIWCLSTAGIILTIRYLSAKVWNHNNRITVLEEK